MPRRRKQEETTPEVVEEVVSEISADSGTSEQLEDKSEVTPENPTECITDEVQADETSTEQSEDKSEESTNDTTPEVASTEVGTKIKITATYGLSGLRVPAKDELFNGDYSVEVNLGKSESYEIDLTGLESDRVEKWIKYYKDLEDKKYITVKVG